ncbi:hypothetical protein OLX02_14590 [Novosphingobium sp. KCTC 2891]|uniref:hypothetical protein n=1 Tax=Novosphingobium sp. KCTC 2891 TaxID=2989730 RepID=UPI0022239A6B|nr:hypothetical protein [Novosphingobium sp. KCTC 2891]MCW1384048.1 hypothetical protein [Novosphingobium sp. KCTC 2891]
MKPWLPGFFAVLLAGTAQAADTAATCARLAGSGICADAAASLIAAPVHTDWTPPADCNASVNDARLGAGEWLFYRAARCGDSTARIEIVPDIAPAAVRELRVAGSDRRIGAIIPASTDPKAAIMALVQSELPAKQAKNCVVVDADVAGLPDGAWSVESRGKRGAAGCGRYGAGADGDAFWLQVGRHVLFFEAGVADLPFDPATLNAVKLGGLISP